jgi:hypothetical protein
MSLIIGFLSAFITWFVAYPLIARWAYFSGGFDAMQSNFISYAASAAVGISAYFLTNALVASSAKNNVSDDIIEEKNNYEINLLKIKKFNAAAWGAWAALIFITILGSSVIYPMNKLAESPINIILQYTYILSLIGLARFVYSGNFIFTLYYVMAIQALSIAYHVVKFNLNASFMDEIYFNASITDVYGIDKIFNTASLNLQSIFQAAALGISYMIFFTNNAKKKLLTESV